MIFKKLILIAFITSLFACMQTLPGPGTEDDPNGLKSGGGKCDEATGIQIGGTSVGCGNPSKSTALNPISLCDEFSNQCIGGQESFPVSIGLGNQFTFKIHFQGDTSLINPVVDTSMHFGNPKALLRFDGQIFAFDSIPLGTYASDLMDSMVINYQQICDSIDRPDHVCSEQKMEFIPISIEIVVPVFSGPNTFLYRAPIQGIAVNTAQKKLEWGDGSRTGEGLWLMPAFGWAEVQLDSSFHNQPDSLFGWLFYIPGTDAFSIACQSDSSASFSNLVSGTMEVRALPLPLLPQQGWQPVYQVDSIHTDPLIGSNQKKVTLNRVLDSIRIPTAFYETRFQNYCISNQNQ